MSSYRIICIWAAMLHAAARTAEAARRSNATAVPLAHTNMHVLVCGHTYTNSVCFSFCFGLLSTTMFNTKQAHNHTSKRYMFTIHLFQMGCLWKCWLFVICFVLFRRKCMRHKYSLLAWFCVCGRSCIEYCRPRHKRQAGSVFAMMLNPNHVINLVNW